MARVLEGASGNGSQTADNQTILRPGDSGTVQLPDGIDASALDMSRAGQDLVLTAPDGQVFVVENYFAMPNAPVIASAGGALLTPGLVQSFLKSAGDVQMAAGQQANDASPVGEVTEVTGNATVIRANQTKEPITAGTLIFEGDVIETDEKGAVNIKFADDSTFAVSENARMAVDDFTFNPADQSGTTGISILRGVFMFTSGLIGRENPDAVEIETPVGSIGIRGTIIGGRIVEGGQSQISVIEGAIVVRNNTGEQILSTQFETVQLSGINAAISNIGTLDAAGMTQSYGAVRGVSPALFTSIDDTARDAAPQNAAPQQTPAQQAPAEATPEPQTQAPQTQAPQTQAYTPAVDAPPVFQALESGVHAQTSAAPAPQASAPATAAPVNTTPANTGPAGAPAPQTQAAPPTTQTPVETAPPPAPSTPAPERPMLVSGGAFEENAPGATIVATAGLAITPAYPVSYSFVSNPGGLFAIDATTGVITLAATAGDYETTANHAHNVVVRVTRTDTNQSTDAGLTLNMTDVNEAPTFGAIALNMAEGGFMYLTPAMIGANDPEGDALTYTLSNFVSLGLQVGGVSATSFTTADLTTPNRVKLVHLGNEPEDGASFTIVASDGSLEIDRNVTVGVTGVNDPATAVYTTTGISLSERDGVGAARTSLSSVGVTDSELTNSNPNYSFKVLHFNGTDYVDDAIGQRFEVFDDGGVWKLALKAGQGFDYETEGSSFNLKIELKDGAHPAILSGAITINITDVNESPDEIVLNDGMMFAPSQYDALVHTRGAESWVAVIDTNDPDENPSFRPTKDDYILSGPDAGYFEVADITADDGEVSQVLKIKPGATIPAGDLSVTITYDDGSGDPIVRGYSFQARTDMMLLESVNGKTGFRIENDYSSGAGMGASIAVDNIDGAGGPEIILAAPRAPNGSNQSSGGFYMFRSNMLGADAAINGEINLSNVNNSITNGVIVTSTGAANGLFASQIAGLGYFNQSPGAEFAVTDTAQGKVDIYSRSSISTQLLEVSHTITGVPTSGTGEIRARSVSIAGIGDINRDGYDDLLIGATSDGSSGGASLILGGPAPTATSYTGGIKSTGTYSGDNYGVHVAALGDINGDGYDDFGIGADNNNGYIRVFLGRSNPAAMDDITISGIVADGHLGRNFTGAGDFNGDGFDDIIARTENVGNGGSVSIILGSAGIATGTMANMNTITFTWDAPESGISVGRAISGAGDFNGDGYDDIMLDVSRDMGSGQYEHTLFIVYGSATPYGSYDLGLLMMDPDKAFKIRLLESENDNITLASAGDLNGDGYDDIIVGTPQYTGDSGQENGSTTVIYGSNYNGVTENISGSNSASGANGSYAGGTGNDILNITNSNTGTSFNGGAGDDALNLHNSSSVFPTNLRHFDGGAGNDTLRLFWSDGESSAETDVIDLRGVSAKVSGVEIIEISGGKLDTLFLDINDVVRMLSENDTGTLRIIGSQSNPGEENAIVLWDGAADIASIGLSNLSAGLRFNNDADNNSQADTQTEGSITYYKYTHNASGAELLIDSRLTNADALAG